MRESDTSAETVERKAAWLICAARDFKLPGAASDVLESAAATLRALAAERDALRSALLRWQHYGCPECCGDCGSANPPVSCCIMRETRDALAQKDTPA
jgi:hypothetical protein